MKKVFFSFIFVVPFLLFSCASKDIPSDSLPQDLAPLSEENVSPEVLDTIQNEMENNLELEKDFSADQISDITSTNLSENKQFTEDYLHQELEEIIEPEVITVEPAQEVIEVIESEKVIEDTEDEVIEIIEEELVVTQNIIESDKKLISEVPAEQTSTPAENSTSLTEKNVSVNVDELQSGIAQTEQPIEITDEVIEITDEEIESCEQKEDISAKIVPSRSVTLKRTEYLDITYPGNGWIYMGITDNSKDITYFGRKVGTENTNFSVQARNAGTKILHFYKNDPITGTFIDDYLEVIVLEEKGSNKTHIKAPEYKSPVLKQIPQETEAQDLEIKQETLLEEQKTETKVEQKQSPENAQKLVEPNKQVSTTKSETIAKSSPVINQESETVAEETPQQTEEPVNPETYLSDAKKQLKEKSYVKAYNNIIRFLDTGTNHIDEALFIKAQILEAKSDIQNINEAIKTYTTLTKNYPASKYWDDSNKRIIYLKRFYLEGR